MGKPGRWPEAIELEDAEQALAGEEATLERIAQQRERASATAGKIKAEIGEAYSTAVLLGADMPTPDPKAVARMRDAESTLEATKMVEPDIRAAVESAKKRMTHLRAVLTGRKLRWTNEQQESAATALREYLAGAAPHVARLMAVSKVREAFAGEPYKASADLPPAFAGFLAGNRLIASIPKRLRPEELLDDAIIKTVAEEFLTLQRQLKELSQ